MAREYRFFFFSFDFHLSLSPPIDGIVVLWNAFVDAAIASFVHNGTVQTETRFAADEDGQPSLGESEKNRANHRRKGTAIHPIATGVGVGEGRESCGCAEEGGGIISVLCASQEEQ